MSGVIWRSGGRLCAVRGGCGVGVAVWGCVCGVRVGFGCRGGLLGVFCGGGGQLMAQWRPLCVIPRLVSRLRLTAAARVVSHCRFLWMPR